jgi:hypothetical protein
MNEAWVFVVLAGCAIVLGVRGSIRLARRYRGVHGDLEPRERLILGALVVVAWTITLVGAYFALLSLRRVLGFPPIEGVSTVSVLVASLVLFIPAGLDAVVERVARIPWRD